MENNLLVPRISVEKLSFSYNGLNVLENISLEVNDGEILVIVGPSGCGKTTLLNLLSGYYSSPSGKVTTRGIIRTVCQEGSLFPWLTVFENICMGFRHLKNKMKQIDEARKLIALVNMKGFEDHYPYQLSGGMKQRVELGRVLAGESDIILMDEPFSALDYQARLTMRKELVQLLQEKPKTVIIVTHDIDEAVQLADRILILSKLPTTIQHQLHIDSPHPRFTTLPKLIDATSIILNKLNLEKQPQLL